MGRFERGLARCTNGPEHRREPVLMHQRCTCDAIDANGLPLPAERETCPVHVEDLTLDELVSMMETLG